jgi:hypothetical protein
MPIIKKSETAQLHVWSLDAGTCNLLESLQVLPAVVNARTVTHPAVAIIHVGGEGEQREILTIHVVL